MSEPRLKVTTDDGWVAEMTETQARNVLPELQKLTSESGQDWARAVAAWLADIDAERADD